MSTTGPRNPYDKPEPGKIPVTEADKDIIASWYEEAKKQTTETLAAFVTKLATEYNHDYGTICHACAAGAIGGLYAVEHGPQGGITGFQAGAIQWEIIRAWGAFGTKDAPMKFVDYENMLYPQYESNFEKTIPPSTMEYLKEAAAKKLKGGGGHPDVVAHWESIAAGNPPFGYVVAEGR